MIFWGRKNIAGECSLKIPYSTIAVKDKTQDWFPLKDIMASSPLEVAEFELLVVFRMNRCSSGG